MRTIKLLVFLGIIAASVNAALGSTVVAAWEFNSISVSSDARHYSLGFSFTPNQAVVITDLGYFDIDGDGFGVAHNVGIFDSVGTLVTFTTLSAGTTDPLAGHFRYRPIDPIELKADTLYVIAATTGGQTDAWGFGHPDDINGLSISPLISVSPNAAVFVAQSDDTLQLPTEHFGYQFYAGPNMLVQVPEPGSIALIFAGAIALGLRRFRNEMAR